MEIIEARYPQGEEGLKAVIQLDSTSKYWNDADGVWESAQTNCYIDLKEQTNSNITCGLYPFFLNCQPRDGFYKGYFKALNIADGVSYSIMLYQEIDGVLTLISTTKRQKPADKNLIELVREVQLRAGYPQSKSIAEPQARKIAGFINDIMNEVIAAGNSLYDLRIKYKVLVKAGECLARISPVNNKSGISSLGKIMINNREVTLYNNIRQKTVDNGWIYNSSNKATPQPVAYIYESKNNFEVILRFDGVLSADTYVEAEVYEKPQKLTNWSDKTILDNDLIIKGAEFLLNDDVGMGGKVSGRDLFLRYLNAHMNINASPDWGNFNA